MNLEYLQTFNYNIDNFFKITTIIIISLIDFHLILSFFQKLINYSYQQLI